MLSLDEFVDKLGETKDKLTWGLVDGQLRGLMSEGGKTLCFCPLTAVAFFDAMTYLEERFPLAAGLRLGMDLFDISSVLCASDHGETSSGLYVTEDTLNLRRRLMEAVQCGMLQQV